MIRMEGVHKSFGTNEVLKGIDANVEKGEVVCVVGPSGSGKSTILRCINGLETYQKGRITVNGQLVDSKSRTMPKLRSVGVAGHRLPAKAESFGEMANRSRW